MAVYVDDPLWSYQGRKWCHLMADTEEELHRFAFALGLQLSSYQGPPKTTAPHYDITGFERDRAVRMGARAVGRREIVELFRRQRVPRSKIAGRKAGVPKLPDARHAARLGRKA